jgi:tetratricopeptide (TPR) repeat protein
LIDLKGPDARDTLVCLNNLAGILEKLGKNKEAEEAFRQALEGLEKLHGPNQIDVSMALNNLGNLLRAQDKSPDAEEMFRRALRIQKVSMGFEHPALQHGLAKALRDQGEFDEADQLFQRVLASCEKMFGPNHPNTAKSLISYASSLEKQEKFKDARPLAERALAIQKKSLPQGHPDLEDTYDVLGKIATGLGNKEEAANYQKLAEGFREKAAEKVQEQAKGTKP